MIARKGWTQVEGGWFTSALGGVCYEGGGKWFAYPLIGAGAIAIGPYRTATAAMEALEQAADKEQGE